MSAPISDREFLERIIAEREKALQTVAGNLEQRLNHLNALREDVIRDRQLFMTKAVYDQMHGDLARRVEIIERFQSRMVGIGIMVVLLSGFIGAVLSHMMVKP